MIVAKQTIYRIMKYDRRRLGNNKKGNPDIADEGYKWRYRTHWKEYIAQISKERSSRIR